MIGKLRKSLVYAISATVMLTALRFGVAIWRGDAEKRLADGEAARQTQVFAEEAKRVAGCIKDPKSAVVKLKPGPGEKEDRRVFRTALYKELKGITITLDAAEAQRREFTALESAMRSARVATHVLTYDTGGEGPETSTLKWEMLEVQGGATEGNLRRFTPAPFLVQLEERAHQRSLVQKGADGLLAAALLLTLVLAGVLAAAPEPEHDPAGLERPRRAKRKGDAVVWLANIAVGIAVAAVVLAFVVLKPWRRMKAAVPAPAAAPPAADKAGIEWVTIPGGTFMIGGDHQVTVRSFELAKSEVTNKQYKACVAAGACAPTAVSESGFDGDDQPVAGVDWAQARLFSEWVGGRLPSEAEWEYAARSGGKDRAYPWGNEDATCDRAVISASSGLGCGRNSTWPVCSMPAGNTEQGLCDMAGNVWEWVEDAYHETFAGAPTDGSAWAGPPGSIRINRGGSWRYGAATAEASFRNPVNPGDPVSCFGFRPAR